MTATMEKQHTSELRVADRCDTRACTAQARVRAHFGESHVDFCGHHFTSVEDAVREQADDITDERDRID